MNETATRTVPFFLLGWGKDPEELAGPAVLGGCPFCDVLVLGLEVRLGPAEAGPHLERPVDRTRWVIHPIGP